MATYSVTAGCKLPIYNLSGRTSLALFCGALREEVEVSASGVGYERSALVEAEDPDEIVSLGMASVGLEWGDRDMASSVTACFKLCLYVFYKP